MCHAAHNKSIQVAVPDSLITYGVCRTAVQEVVTAVKLKLHITILVLNDNAYGVRAQKDCLVECAMMCCGLHFSQHSCPFSLCCHAVSGA